MQQFTGTYETFGVSFNSSKDECFYCHTGLTDKNRTKDHIIPKSRNGILSNTNKLWCCVECNSLKANLDPYQFKEKLEKIILKIDTIVHKKDKEYYITVLETVNQMILKKESQPVVFKYKLLAISFKDKIAYVKKNNGGIYCMRPPYPLQKERSTLEVVDNVIKSNGYVFLDLEFINSSEIIKFIEKGYFNQLKNIS